jgi:hypothetical protein
MFKGLLGESENTHEQWANHVSKFSVGGIEAYKRGLANRI